MVPISHAAQEIIRIVHAKGRIYRNIEELPADVLGLLRLSWKDRPRHQYRDVAASERWLVPEKQPGPAAEPRASSARLVQATVKKAAMSLRPVTRHSLRNSLCPPICSNAVCDTPGDPGTARS